MRLVLKNCGRLDPESLDDYIAADGYRALLKAVEQSTPEADHRRAEGQRSARPRRRRLFHRSEMEVLRAKPQGDEKYVICNADEGDPGAYMDRSVLEGDPHSRHRGHDALPAYAIGATQGYFYIRAEYPLAVERVQKAIDQARELRPAGQAIFSASDFAFDVEIRLGAGAFVCGEETALIASIEGKRGTPAARGRPIPSVKGLWGKPTVHQQCRNPGQCAPHHSQRGATGSPASAREKSKGTKVFAVTGKISNSGLVEVPMGTTLREIVFDIGGGIASGKAFKAVQTGGPSGGVIPSEYLDTPVDYDNLQKLGSIMGSGGMIVMDEDDCMVDIAKFYLEFCVDESCGKCAPCRIGGYQMLHMLDGIIRGPRHA